MRRGVAGGGDGLRWRSRPNGRLGGRAGGELRRVDEREPGAAGALVMFGGQAHDADRLQPVAAQQRLQSGPIDARGDLRHAREVQDDRLVH